MGGPTALGSALGVAPQSFYVWRQVPAERVLKMAEVTGMHPSEIRPDLYPAEGIPPAKTGE